MSNGMLNCFFTVLFVQPSTGIWYVFVCVCRSLCLFQVLYASVCFVVVNHCVWLCEFVVFLCIGGLCVSLSIYRHWSWSSYEVWVCVYKSQFVLIAVLQLIKAGLVLTLFGGCHKYVDDKNRIPIRGDPHMLVVGDPGLGKSQMLQVFSLI